ncbi:MAG TPA: DUF1190 domain-containing protein [Methylocystis sp.]|jgi:hypothetical protein
MSNIPASPITCRDRTAAVRLSPAISIACLLSFFEAEAASAALAGKAFFFASREACVASQAFTRQECASAFANAREQLLDLAPRFSSGGECRLRFQLCEISGAGPLEEEAVAYAEAEEPVAYTPVAIGVEMAATMNGVEAAPTLAIDGPAKLFPRFPVSQIYERREEADRYGAILPADRFQPFPKRKPMDVRQIFRPFALGALDEGGERPVSQETPQERRERLRNAPFVE